MRRKPGTLIPIELPIADEWTARGSVVNDAVWTSAHHVARLHKDFGKMAFLLLMASVIAFGMLVTRKATVPRWVSAIGLLGGLVFVFALVGALISESAFWWPLVASLAIGGLWLVVTGAWLALKGVYQPTGRVGAA